ncbi:MAG: type IV pilus twitching motility protein PilT [Rickettsiales bacterium]
MEFAQLAEFAVEKKASDIHLSPGLPPMVRLNGDVHKLNIPVMKAEEIVALLHGIMNEDQKIEFEKEKELDFAIAVSATSRFRVNAFTTMNGAAAAFRRIPVEIKSLAQLGAPEVFEKFTEFTKGLVLVTGPTGSGKSTTLAGMINHINETENAHIITVEDPIEFVHKSKQSLINQREVGTDTKSFARALKSALREDPDVILVGEMRDKETISLALTAAETGHLVFGTLHTSSAAKTMDRIIDVFPGDDKEMVRAMLAGSVQAVISQRLCKKKDGSGRIAAYEILVATPAIRNMIRENKIPQINSLMQIGSKDGMCLMEDYVRGLVNDGQVALSDVNDLIKETKEEKDLLGQAKKTGATNHTQQPQEPVHAASILITNKSQAKSQDDF